MSQDASVNFARTHSRYYGPSKEVPLFTQGEARGRPARLAGRNRGQSRVFIGSRVRFTLRFAGWPRLSELCGRIAE